ncbi:hypothetical protein N2152v2_005718 [Parachlorella kessleri]
MAALRYALYRVGFWVRETGQALDKLGSRLTGNYAYREDISRHRTLLNLFDKVPSLGNNVFVAPSAAVIGNVKLGDKASVFYGSVLRADAGSITVGAHTNIQDHCMIRTGSANLGEHDADTIIGDRVTVGHRATLHGVTLEDEVLVGMASTLQHGVKVEKGAMVAAGAVVEPGTTIPAGQIWGGNPAKFLRDLKPEEAKYLAESAEAYVALSAEHLQRASLGPLDVAKEKGLA